MNYLRLCDYLFTKLGMKRNLRQADNENIPDMESMTSIAPDPKIGAVLMGFDLNINYKKLAKAYTYLTSNPDCLFLATNDDATFPAGPRLYPGCGSLQSPLTTAMLGRLPKVIGKPHRSMLDVVVNQ